MSDGTRVTFSVAGLLARIGRQCEAVLERHAAMAPEQYNDDEAFFHTVAEMLETRAAAVATLRCYISDSSAIVEILENAMRTSHCEAPLQLCTGHTWRSWSRRCLRKARRERRRRGGCAWPGGRCSRRWTSWTRRASRR